MIFVRSSVKCVCVLLRSNNNVLLKQKQKKKGLAWKKHKKGDEDNTNEEMGAEDLKRGATMDKF